MLSILRNKKIIVSILTMAFLIVGAQGMSYAQAPDPEPDPEPDLVLRDLILPTTDVNAGARFNISITVANIGDANATATTVIFFRDVDSNDKINSGDEIVGFDTVAALDAVNTGTSDEDTVEISVLAPSDTGDYNYGAYVIPVAGETFLTNNYEDSSDITVVNPDEPNLQVINLLSSTLPSYNQITGLSYTVAPNINFTLTAVVRNDGRAPFTDPTLAFQYYISTSRTLPANTPWVTMVAVPITTSIAVGRSWQVSITLPPPTSPTFNTYPYHYHVRVAPVDGVSDEANNRNISIPITTASADLAVDTPTVDKSTLAPGESFTLTTTVRNQGSGLSGAATLRYYRSTNATIDTTTTPVGTATIGILSGSNTLNQGYPSTSPQTVTLTAPTAPGTYYYRAHVSINSSTTTETNTTNNYSTVVSITVTAPPDLVAEILDFRPDTVAPGARLTLDATVTNEGEGQSPRTPLRFYESTDRRFSSADEIDRVSVAELASNRSTNESIRWIAPDTPGTYYYRVEVDAVPNEEATFNNTSDYIVLYVETPLTIESVQPSTSTLSPGERFTLTATLRNDGTTTSARTSVAFYSSDDNSITSRDTSIGTDSVSAIAARGTSQASLTLNAPTAAGTYYYGACIGDNVGSNCLVTEITVVDMTIANFRRPPMYWVESGTLQSLTDSEIEPFASGVRNANSIAVDMEGGKVYWTQQTGANSGRVQRADLSGSNVELVRALNNLPNGIAVDASNGKLYVTNASGKIQQMDLDGSNYEPDFIVNLDSPGGIAVDAAGGKVYWTEQVGGDKGRIQRADLDGSNVASVRELNNVPYGIAVDGSNGKLYVTNDRGKIQRMNLDGSNYEWNFIIKLDSPLGIAVDVAAGKVYWTEEGTIRRANLNGSNRQDVVTGIESLAGIALSVAPVSMEAPAAPAAAAIAPNATALHANYPNPFNPETWIPYQLQHAADVTVTIYDMRGMTVRQLLLGHQPAGVYHSRSRAAYWDGRNNLGEPVASGLYFYTLTAGDFRATRKMLIRK